MFTDFFTFASLDNEEDSLESSTKQLQTNTETVENASSQDSTLCSEDATSRLKVSSSPETNDITLPETAVTTSGSENENLQGESNETFEVSSGTADNQETIIVEETKTEEQGPTEEQRKQDSMYHNDYRFGLRLRVHYRINEEAIRCLLLLRWVGWVGWKGECGAVGCSKACRHDIFVGQLYLIYF